LDEEAAPQACRSSFYRGTTKMILDLSLRPEIKFIRASLGIKPLGPGGADPHVL